MSMSSSAKPGGDHLCHHTERTSSRITTNRKAKPREGASKLSPEATVVGDLALGRTWPGGSQSYDLGGAYIVLS